MSNHYFCPMHPEVQQDRPGSCPICGMSLILSISESSNGSHNHLDEVKDFSFKLSLGIAFFLPLLFFAMHETPFSYFMQLILTTPIVFYCGGFILKRAYESLLNKSLNMFSLIALGVLASYFFSFILSVSSVAPKSLYYESAAMITLLVILGQLLEAKAQSKTRTALQELLEKGAKTAFLIVDGKEKEVPVEQVAVNDFVKVKPGSTVPVDGVVIEGQSDVDESMLTGEPLFALKKTGSKVLAGSLNQTGAFIMQAKNVGHETLFYRIWKMVNEATLSRPPIQKIADTLSSYFVPFTLLIALLTALLWLFFGGLSSLSQAFTSAVSVLIIACPCALGLAAPVSMTVGIGQGAKMGILIKNAEALENLKEVKMVVFDKTGTLTLGKPILTKIIPEVIPEPGFTENEILTLGASLESFSEHPLAKALVESAKIAVLPILKVEQFKSSPGNGISGIVKGKKVLIGNRLFVSGAPSESPNHSGTWLFISVDGVFAGTFILEDELKKTALHSIEELKAMGIKLALLSGDTKNGVEKIARPLGLEFWRGGQLPQDKYEFILEQKKIMPVAMAGDGVNDAPAIAAATVGIAMGTGSDAAIESADVTLLKGDLSGIAKAIFLSRAVMKNIYENLFLAFAYNIAAIPIAAGLFYPWTGWQLTPGLAALAMTLSSLSVLLNALRLKRDFL